MQLVNEGQVTTLELKPGKHRLANGHVLEIAKGSKLGGIVYATYTRPGEKPMQINRIDFDPVSRQLVAYTVNNTRRNTNIVLSAVSKSPDPTKQPDAASHKQDQRTGVSGEGAAFIPGT